MLGAFIARMLPLAALLTVCFAEETKATKSDLWYTPEGFNKDLASEIEYLGSQDATSWIKEGPRIRAALPPAPTDGSLVTVLDAGCGPGHTSHNILREFPFVRVKCMDVQAPFLEYANKIFARDFPADRFETLQSQLPTIPLADSSVDFVHARLVLQHIAKINETLKEFSRVLKPGGTLFIMDTDESMGDILLPQVEEVDELLEIHNEERHNENKGHTNLSAHLWFWLEQAGFSRIAYDSMSFHSKEHPSWDIYGPMTSPKVYYSLVRKGLVSKSQVQDAEAKWEEAVKQYPPIMVVHMWTYVAHKGTNSAREEL